MHSKARNLIFVGIGIIGLLFSRHYSGPFENMISSFGANITFSFGAYFILKLSKLRLFNNKFINGGVIFLGVSLQEIAQGLHVCSGTYDPLDFLFNTIGISIAIFIDMLITRKSTILK
jgi:hypothetical protein